MPAPTQWRTFSAYYGAPVSAFLGTAREAVIGRLPVVVKKAGMDVTKEQIMAHLAEKVAKWWLPDAIEFVDAIPHGATGKISKKDLRDQFRDYKLAEA